MWPDRKHHTLSRVGISALLVLLLCSCSGEKPEQAFAKAQASHAKGDQAAAIIELKNTLQLNPEHTEARRLLGEIHLAEGDGASAEKELRRALQLGAPKNVILPKLAQALILQREFQKVLDEVPPKPEGTPQEVAAMLVMRGYALAGQQLMAEAKSAFEEARQLDPKSAEAIQGLASLAYSGNQPEDALRLAEEATQLGSHQAAPWILKARLLRVQGKLAESTQAYQEALKREPGNIDARLQLATLYLQNKQVDAAQQEISAARKIQPNAPAVRLAQAQFDFLQKKYSQARDGLQEVLKSAPNNGSAILLMGATQLALESYSQAETYLSAFVKAVPNDVYARRLLAATYLKSQQPMKAVDTLGPLLGAETDDAAVLALAGDAYMRLKEYAKATEYLERAAKARPESAALRTELAVSRVASGDTVRGTAELEAAAAMEDSPLQTDVTLIYAYLNKKDFDKALKAIDALEKKEPNNPLVYNLRGATYMAKQDPGAARKAFEKALSLNPGYYPSAANLAQIDLRDKNPIAARKRFDDVLAADKNNVSAMVAIAGLERAAGREQPYVEWLQKASRADAKAIKPRALLVQYHINKKEVQQALVIARDAQTANPSNAEALDLLGNAQLAAGEKDNAVATFGKLAALVPASPLAHLRLAAAQSANKNPREARKSLNKALELNPNLIDAQLALIGLDMQEQRPNDAVKRAVQIQQKQPKSPAGYVVLGDIHYQQNEFTKASEQYQKAFDLNQNGPLLMKLHGALSRGGKAAEADAKVARWIKDHPDDHGVRITLAEAKMAAGAFAEATAHYLYLNQKLPRQIGILNNLAYALAEQKDKRAVTYAEEAVKLQGENAAILDTYGWALAQTGQASKSLDFFKRALSMAPDMAEIRYHYAVGLVRSGDTRRAEAELKRLSESGNKFRQEHEAAALLAKIRGQ